MPHTIVFPHRPLPLHAFHFLRSRACTVALAAAASLAGGAVHAQHAQPPAQHQPAHATARDIPQLDDSGNYREELQACREGRTGEDRATCQREARNAAADKRRGVLTNRGDFQANALARCNAHRDKVDHDACRERVLGEGSLSGSVAGGGMLRELEVTLPPEQQPQQAQQGTGPTGTLGAGPGQPAQPPATSNPQEPMQPEAPLSPEPDDQMPAMPAPSDEVPAAPMEPDLD